MEKFVTIRIPLSRALELQHGFSDLGCWARGFVTALPPDDRAHYEPMGTRELRDMNIILKGAIGDAEEGMPDPVDAALEEVMVMAYRTSSAARAAGHVRAHRAAAYIHDQIVNVKLRGKSLPPLVGAPWPFPEQGE